MVKPFGDYHPPEGWVKFETLKPGAKFHNVEGPGLPTQYLKLQSETGTYAANLDNGLPVLFDLDEYVYPIDTGWVAELAGYGFKISEKLQRKGYRAIIAHVMSHCEARKADERWRKEIERYFPQLAVMSFSGPKRTIEWLMDRVIPKDDDAQLANKLTAIEASDLPPDQKARARLEAMFPNLRGDSGEQEHRDEPGS
jgi:hypothetical protein